VSTLYIRLYSSFFTNRKTVRLRAKIGDDAFWVPPRLWAYAADNQPDGDFSGYTSEEIAMLVGCEKHASSIRQALLDAGFLDASGKIHDWEEHNGYHKTFSDRAKHAADSRWGKERDKDKDIDRETSIALSNAPSMPKHRKRLERPTLEMCKANAVEIGLPADEGEQFLNHHEARGWKDIVDWKAAMRTWRGNWKKWGGDSKQPALASKPKPLFVQIRELEARIDTHPGNWNWLKYNAKTATKEQKDEYRALLKQLEAMQAGQEPLPMGEGGIP
jgi:hypothetical protein